MHVNVLTVLTSVSLRYHMNSSQIKFLYTDFVQLFKCNCGGKHTCTQPHYITHTQSHTYTPLPAHTCAHMHFFHLDFLTEQNSKRINIV